MNILERIMVEPFERFYEKLLVFLPNLITSVILLIIGIILAVVVKWAFNRIFRAVNLDGLAQKMGLTDVLSRSGVKEPPSLLIARILKWLTIITFVIVAMQNLSIPTVEHLVDRMFLYLPNIFIAGLILILGYLVANFVGRAVLIASVNAGMATAGIIGRAVKFTVFILSCTMALEQLGIGKETIVIAFAIIFGGIVLAFSLAFGLGGKDMAENFLRKKMKGTKDGDDDIDHL